MPTGRDGASLGAAEGSGTGSLGAWTVSRKPARLKRWETAYAYITMGLAAGDPTHKNRWTATPCLKLLSVELYEKYQMSLQP